MVRRQLEGCHSIFSFKIKRVIGVQEHFNNMNMVSVHCEVQCVDIVLISAEEIDTSLGENSHCHTVSIHTSYPERIYSKVVYNLNINCFIHET
jgi:hypothetical protein